MTIELPEAVRSSLQGLPVHGQPEAAVPLLTTDDLGWPHVCLLSRAQLAVRDGGIGAVVTSRQTRANLRARPLATLVSVTPLAAVYSKFRMAAFLDDEWALTVALDLVSVKTDPAPMGLTPTLYTPSAEIERVEQWSRCVELLSRIA